MTINKGDFVQQGGAILYVEAAGDVILHCLGPGGEFVVVRTDDVHAIPAGDQLITDWYNRRLATLHYMLRGKQQEVSWLQTEIDKWETMLHGTPTNSI